MGIEAGKSYLVTQSRPLRVVAYSLVFLIISLLFTATGRPQDDPAPPPSQSVSKDELQRLAFRPSIKERTKLALELMNTHLESAERFKENETFEAAYRELGAFHGLLDNMMNYLTDADQRRVKVLDEFKRAEIGLRGFLPRIEGIRRDLPLNYDDYVRSLMKRVRDARAAAAEPFFIEGGNS